MPGNFHCKGVLMDYGRRPRISGKADNKHGRL